MTYFYGWGANSHGQLGLGYVSEQVLEPTRIEDLPDNLCDSTIKLVCGGGGHSLILTNDGKLFGAGLNTAGQVGIGTQEKSVTTFHQIRGLEEQVITDVSCGWSHSVALNNQGQVLVWGSNIHCQLGLRNDEVPFTCLPIMLDINNVSSIGAGLRHTAVATKDGHVYTWGQGTRGQLGCISEEGEIIKQQAEPKKVDMIKSKIVQVACGQNTTYALSSEGQVFAWGDNKWGQLGHNPTNVAFFSCPLAIPVNYFGGEKTCWLKAGWTHCAAGVSTGEVYVWGRCDYGQIGPPLEDEIVKDDSKVTIYPSRCRYIPSILNLGKRMNQFESGSEHNLSLVTEGDDVSLVSWGWNEHGNCGNGHTNNVHSPTTIQMRERVLLIGTGAGHSFAVTKSM